LFLLFIIMKGLKEEYNQEISKLDLRGIMPEKSQKRKWSS